MCVCVCVLWCVIVSREYGLCIIDSHGLNISVHLNNTFNHQQLLLIIVSFVNK